MIVLFERHKNVFLVPLQTISKQFRPIIFLHLCVISGLLLCTALFIIQKFGNASTTIWRCCLKELEFIILVFCMCWIHTVSLPSIQPHSIITINSLNACLFNYDWKFTFTALIMHAGFWICEWQHHVLQRNFMKSLSFLFENTSDGFQSMSRDCGCLDVFMKIVFNRIKTIALQESMKTVVVI